MWLCMHVYMYVYVYIIPLKKFYRRPVLECVRVRVCECVSVSAGGFGSGTTE